MKVCLDACVLYPTVLREILLGVAERGAFAPIWSERILEEWARATVKLGPGAETIARGEIALLAAHWPRASVAPRQRDLDRLWLPDADDVHVLASAIAASADLLCTVNARDFPRGVLAGEGVERLDPDQLLLRLWEEHEAAIADVTRRVHATAERLAETDLALKALLKRARLPRLAKRLGP